MRPWVGLVLTVGAMAQTTPTLYVQNAADSSQMAVAPGSIITLSPVSAAASRVPVDPSLIKVTLQPQGSSQIYSAVLLPNAPFPFAWAVVPDAMPTGPATVTLAIIGSASLSTSVTITPAAPGLFTAGRNGYGPALAQNITESAAPALNQLTNPALPGGIVTLWGTGLGASKTSDVRVEIAGETVAASYAGRAPGLPGVDQINFQLPADVYLGCYVPVDIRIGGVVSNQVTLAINSTPGVCAHPLGLSYSDLQTLDQGGQVFMGELQIGSNGNPPVGYALFYSHDAAAVFRAAGTQAPVAEPSCAMGSADVKVLLLGPGPSNGDAGPALTLTGPDGRSFAISDRGEGNGIYGGAPSPLTAQFYIAGTWQIAAPGGRDIAAFLQSFTLPPPVRWNPPNVINRSSDVTIQWSPQGYAVSDLVTISLSAPPAPTQLTCSAFGLTGQLVLPSSLLQMLPAAQGYLFSMQVAPLRVARVRFALPLTTGASAPAVIDYSISDSRLVTIQ